MIPSLGAGNYAIPGDVPVIGQLTTQEGSSPAASHFIIDVVGADSAANGYRGRDLRDISAFVAIRRCATRDASLSSMKGRRHEN